MTAQVVLSLFRITIPVHYLRVRDPSRKGSGPSLVTVGKVIEVHVPVLLFLECTEKRRGPSLYGVMLFES